MKYEELVIILNNLNNERLDSRTPTNFKNNRLELIDENVSFYDTGRYLDDEVLKVEYDFTSKKLTVVLDKD